VRKQPGASGHPRKRKRREWWQRFFGPDYLRMYRFDQASNRRQAVDAEKLLGISPPAAVLDLCCGQGRHAVELAARGFQVTGLDASKFLLREARKAARKRKVEVGWVHGDMREIPFRNQFDAVVNLFTSFGYFETKAEDLAVLRGVRRALKTGGLLLIDTANNHYDNDFHVKEWVEVRPGTFVLYERRFHASTGRMDEHRILITPKRRRSYDIKFRMYSKSGLERMLIRAGLEPLQWFGRLDGRPFDPDGHRLVVLAQKPTRSKRGD